MICSQVLAVGFAVVGAVFLAAGVACIAFALYELATYLPEIRFTRRGTDAENK